MFDNTGAEKKKRVLGWDESHNPNPNPNPNSSEDFKMETYVDEERYTNADMKLFGRRAHSDDSHDQPCKKQITSFSIPFNHQNLGFKIISEMIALVTSIQ